MFSLPVCPKDTEFTDQLNDGLIEKISQEQIPALAEEFCGSSPSLFA